MTIAIHCEPQIPWQGPFARKMSVGLNAIGISNYICPSRVRETDQAILLGTTMWRRIERDGEYLLVDRCSFNDTNQYVSLVWNGHGRRGDHKVPEHYDDSRWNLHGVQLQQWKDGKNVILCGQIETYSPAWDRIQDWYDAAKSIATHFRPHPAETINQTQLPLSRIWEGCRLAVTLNSSVAVQAIIEGVDTLVDDEGGMAFNWLDNCNTRSEARRALMEYLAWTQWHHNEIEAGKPIAHLFI